MNHLKLLCIAFVLLLLCAQANPASGQTYETDFGWRDSDEIPWDGIWPPSSRPVTLVNTNQTGTISALLTLNRNFDGVALQSTSIYKSGYRLEGRSLRPVDIPFPASPVGYHLTGFWRKQFLLSPATAYLLSTDWVGRPQKCRKKVTKGFSEVGMVVEETGPYVLVAGNASPQLVFLPLPTPPLTTLALAPSPASPGRIPRFWAARFEANSMNKIWAFDYFSSDTAQFVVQEGCTATYVKGTQKQAGLALTGYYIKKGETARHTFVSMIDFQTGQEVWRTVCLSPGIVADEGFDIVQDSESGTLLTVGYARRETNGVKRMYTCALDAAGVHLGSTYHDLSPNLNIRDMVARDVCLSLNAGHAVATGYVVNPQGVSEIKTFAMELSIQPLSVPTWTVYYDLSFSDLSGSEAIDRVKGDQNFTPGYLITTGGRLFHVPIANGDGQVLKILPANGQLEDGCPTTPFKPEPRLLEPLKPAVRFYQLKSRWCKDRVKYSTGEPFSSTCKE